MVKAETHEEDPSVNVVTRSSVATNEDKGENLNAAIWIRKAPEKKYGFYLQCAKDTFVEAWKGFAEGSALTSGRPMKEAGVDDEIKSFWQACIKLLRNKKVVENLQAMIDNYTEKEQPLIEQRVVNKIYKNKKRMGREMHMTTQIDAYEMYHVILDPGSDANLLPNKTWQRMGEPKL